MDAAGAHTWIDREDIEGGKNWKSAIREAVKGARFFIACFSKFFADCQRTVMFDELRQAADELRMRPPTTQWFLPVLLDEVEVPDLEVSATEYPEPL